MLIAPSVMVYVIASIVVEAALVGAAMPLIAAPTTGPVDDDTLIADDDDDQADVLPAPPAVEALLLWSCLLYVIGYATPGLLPLSVAGTNYRTVVVVGTVADIVGRVVVSKLPAAAAVAFGTFTVCILGNPSPTGPVTMALLVGTMYTLRASAIVRLQLRLREVGGTAHAGRATQLGTVIGAIIGMAIARA